MEQMTRNRQPDEDCCYLISGVFDDHLLVDNARGTSRKPIAPATTVRARPLMERHQILVMLHRLKLCGMRTAFDEVLPAVRSICRRSDRSGCRSAPPRTLAYPVESASTRQADPRLGLQEHSHRNRRGYDLAVRKNGRGRSQGRRSGRGDGHSPRRLAPRSCLPGFWPSR
jgi:hypothetical protein